MRLIDADKLDMSVKVDGDRTLSPISQLIAQTIIENAQTIESDEDCISRQVAIEAFKPRGIAEDVWQECHEYRVLSSLPPVTPKPKMGHWEQYGYSWEDKFKCSECGKEQPKILCGERIIGHWSDYCPNCGADMKESEDKE